MIRRAGVDRYPFREGVEILFDRLAVLLGWDVIAALAQFVAAPLWGRLSDAFGRKPILALTSFGFAASYIVLAYADSLALLVASRIFGGFMAGNIAAANENFAPRACCWRWRVCR